MKKKNTDTPVTVLPESRVVYQVEAARFNAFCTVINEPVKENERLNALMNTSAPWDK